MFLDIEGAFPNAVNERLIHNMRVRRVPKKIVEFIQNLLRGQYTALKFDDFTSSRIALNNGIRQGDPLSMVLYQYYNADLLDIPNSTGKAAATYMDDAILVATASDFMQTHKKLIDMMTRQGGAIEWSKPHNSRFKFSKLMLIDFAHRNKKMQRSPVVLPDVTIEPSFSTKYLRVYLDQHLSWKLEYSHCPHHQEGDELGQPNQRSSSPIMGYNTKTCLQTLHKCCNPQNPLCSRRLGHTKGSENTRSPQKMYSRSGS